MCEVKINEKLYRKKELKTKTIPTMKSGTAARKATVSSQAK
jgi:hypothetical protein